MNGPLVVIVGETASGKSALAFELAQKFNGEIICADSRTVYRGMDIGTAKPTFAEQAMLSHHCLDLVAPDEQFTAAEFKKCAVQAIDDITSRGKLPIMVGGSGLYIDAVVFDYQFLPPVDPAERERLQSKSIEDLQQELIEKGIPMPVNERNPRHLTRAIETGGMLAQKSSLRSNTLMVGLQVEREVLKQRIVERVDAMVEKGLVDEVRSLADQYGWATPSLGSTGYKAFREYIEGDISMDEAKSRFIKNDVALAKRQRTWFRRNNSVHWVSNRDSFAECVELITTQLNK